MSRWIDAEWLMKGKMMKASELVLLIAIIAEFYLHFSMRKLSERVDNFEEWVVFLLQKRNDGTTSEKPNNSERSE